MARTVDLGIITGSGVGGLLDRPEPCEVETRYGRVEAAVAGLGPWTVGVVSRHGRGHRHLPHTVPYRANLAALGRLGARAVLATSVVGVVDPALSLGRPILFDDLFFPSNRMPDGSTCTFFEEPEDPARGHFIPEEPFSPRLRHKAALAAESLGLEPAAGGVYGHVDGPRFNTAVEVRWLERAGVSAVSQTCGPEAVLAGELELPYGLVGFPVNYTAGVAAPEPKSELDRLLKLSAEVMPRLLGRTVETLEGGDLTFNHGYVYRIEEGAPPDSRKPDPKR